MSTQMTPAPTMGGPSYLDDELRELERSGTDPSRLKATRVTAGLIRSAIAIGRTVMGAKFQPDFVLPIADMIYRIENDILAQDEESDEGPAGSVASDGWKDEGT